MLGGYEVAKKLKKWKHLPHDNGGLTLPGAEKEIEKMMTFFGEQVSLGGYSVKLELHPYLGTVIGVVRVHFCKKGWAPPPEAVADFAESIRQKKERAKKRASPQPTKKAR
jgi:hypothetical protein